MNELTTEKTMTVKEAAEVLGVSPDTVYNSAKELFPELFSPGKTTYLDEAQVTAIKMNLRKNSEVAKQPITDLEAAAMLLKSAEHFKTRFEQEHSARVEAEKRLADQGYNPR